MQTLHWFWVAFFALFGVALLWRPRFLGADCLCRGFLGLRENEQQERAVQALRRRIDAEHISPVPGYVGGAGSLIIATVSAFSSVQPVVYYALFSLWISAVIAMMFLQLRNAQPKRVAVLTPRSPSAVIPPWIAIGAVLSALSALAYVTHPGYAAVSVVICCSTLITFAIAWRLTQLPALLQGEDLAAEVYIDNRLRVNRSAGPLILAVVQPFALSSIVAQTNGLQFAAMVLTTAMFVCVAAWCAYAMYKPASLAAA